jgi:hypothetical protein
MVQIHQLARRFAHQGSGSITEPQCSECDHDLAHYLHSIRPFPYESLLGNHARMVSPDTLGACQSHSLHMKVGHFLCVRLSSREGQSTPGGSNSDYFGTLLGVLQQGRPDRAPLQRGCAAQHPQRLQFHGDWSLLRGQKPEVRSWTFPCACAMPHMWQQLLQLYVCWTWICTTVWSKGLPFRQAQTIHICFWYFLRGRQIP